MKRIIHNMLFLFPFVLVALMVYVSQPRASTPWSTGTARNVGNTRTAEVIIEQASTENITQWYSVTDVDRLSVQIFYEQDHLMAPGNPLESATDTVISSTGAHFWLEGSVGTRSDTTATLAASLINGVTLTPLQVGGSVTSPTKELNVDGIVHYDVAGISKVRVGFRADINDASFHVTIGGHDTGNQ